MVKLCNVMDAINQIKCLEAKGLISSDVADDLIKIIAALPDSIAGLLQVMIALQITGGPVDSMPPNEPVLGVQSIFSTDTATPVTLTIPAETTKALISVHGNNIVFRTDGGTPAPNVGHFAAQGSNFMLTLPALLAAFKFVSTSTVDAYIFVTYY